MLKHYEIWVRGIVQGVGFRPFIYNLAGKFGLKGEVVNTSKGVKIKVEGKPADIEGLIREIKMNPPPLAQVQQVEAEEQPLTGYQSFSIRQSQGEEERQTLISPDVAICNECLAEFRHEADRRHKYPFINCTNCGPRFTIIEDVPYDRPKTTMKCFPMCADCLAEYENPADRRFHAQPNACPECGPQVKLINAVGETVETDDPIAKTAELLSNGKIIGLKGLGGYHLACDAKSDLAVKELRGRKYREDKPFAVMFAQLERVRDYCYLSEADEQLLASIRRPIVLLRKNKEKYDLAEEVAPENDFLGAMLPYTPLHYVLFEYFSGVLVMTSANVSDEPIAYKDEDALNRLAGIADYFLTHNREIRHRCDDSVTRSFMGQEYLIRRSRGYAPAPLVFEKTFNHILACGGEQKNTFCLTKGNYAFVSHHIGDLENLETLESFTEGIELYKKLFEIEPRLIAHDLHPEYLSTKYAADLTGIPKVAVQHHHAHIAGCMAENNLTDQVIGVAFDGTGYGTDGQLWGGEFLVAGLRAFDRAAHLKYLPLPGGAKAIKEPWRMAASYLLNLYELEQIPALDLNMVSEVGVEKIELVREMTAKKINSPLTSSMGRLFDAVAAILNIRTRVNYEGQGAVELEQKAHGCSNKPDSLYPFIISTTAEVWEIDAGQVIREIIADLAKGHTVEYISYKFHRSVAELVVETCWAIRGEFGLRDVCLSGGVFQNLLLLEIVVEKLKGEGFYPYIHRRLPTNDGGISLGQAVIANERG